MRFRRRVERKRGSLDIAPLVDVIFLLLLFFMLTSNFVLLGGIRLQLPASELTESQKEEGVTVVIGERGETFFNREALLPEALRQRLRREALAGPDRLVIVRADRCVPHGRVVEVMGMVKKAGFSRIAIGTRREVESAGE